MTGVASRPVLWGRATSVNVQKVMWLLAEIGLDHDRRDAGGRHGPVDPALNPQGKVPVWVERALVLPESHAILRHLARVHAPGMAGEGDAHGMAVADRWMEFVTNTAQPAFVGCFWQLVRLPRAECDAALLARHRADLDRALTLLDQRLQEADWLGGAAFGLADIAAGALMYRIVDTGLMPDGLPEVARWHAALRKRPAFMSAIETSYDELRAPD